MINDINNLVHQYDVNNESIQSIEQKCQPTCFLSTKPNNQPATLLTFKPIALKSFRTQFTLSLFYLKHTTYTLII